MLSAAPVLAIYNIEKPVVVSCNASSYGLGSVLLQLDKKGHPCPVSYISRTLLPIEHRYAQIEKELLAITWACEKFSVYLVSHSFKVKTVHKPLIPILSTKFFDDLSPHLQCLCMHLLRFGCCWHLIQSASQRSSYNQWILCKRPT